MSYHASDETISRLRWHAGLDQTGGDGGPTVAECTGNRAAANGLDGAIADVVTTLAELNRELNGLVPSDGTTGATQVPRMLVYAITEITRMLRDNVGSDDAGWTVETAWNAVLAGDIDDLEQHVRSERAARDQ